MRVPPRMQESFQILLKQRWNSCSWLVLRPRDLQGICPCSVQMSSCVYLNIIPLKKFFFYLFIYFWPQWAACEILVPRPGMDPTTPAVEAQRLNHCTDRGSLIIPCSL